MTQEESEGAEKTSSNPNETWSPQPPAAPPSADQPWEDSIDMNICGVSVRLGLSDVGCGTTIFVHSEVDAVWAISFRGLRHIVATHKHFPYKPSRGSSDEVITIQLMALLPSVEVDGWIATWKPTIYSVFRVGDELRSKTFLLEGMELTIMFYPLGEKYGVHCTFFIRAVRQTQHIFAFGVDNQRRCAAHEWLREGAWGFPQFGAQILRKGCLNLSLELLGPIPPVKVQNEVANWKFEWSQVAPFSRGEEVRSSSFRLQGIELSIFYYPKGTKEGDGAHLAIFLKSSRAFAAQMCVDEVGPRSLSHDGRGVWGYPTYCAISLPNSLHFKIEVLCWRDQTIPRRLHVSRSLCERAQLRIPPPLPPNVPLPTLLWLGGDAGSISRSLMAWYFLMLGVELHWCQGTPDEYWTPFPGMKVVAVATGDDELIGVQDNLAQRLGLHQNDPTTTWYRQHKFAQRFAVEPDRKDYRLVHAEFDALRKAIEGIGGYPAVIKIPLSDSSAGVCIVENEDEINLALKSTIGPATHWEVEEFQSLDVQDEMQKALSYRYASPRQVLLETLFIGTEYVTNCVSAAGVHIVTDCWVSRTKIPEEETKRPLYDTQSLCDIPEVVHAFTMHALDACGLRCGASHLELILGHNGECRLIELNARLAGDFPRAHGTSDTPPGSDYLTRVGANQFSLLALSVAHEEDFIAYALACNRRPGRIKEHVTAVFLRSTRDCKLLGSGMSALCMLPTFNGLRRAMGHLPVPAAFHPLKLALEPDKGNPESPRFAEFGSNVVRTMSLRSCPGVVLLRSSNEDAIQADVEAIRALERDGLYSEPPSVFVANRH